MSIHNDMAMRSKLYMHVVPQIALSVISYAKCKYVSKNFLDTFKIISLL